MKEKVRSTKAKNRRGALRFTPDLGCICFVELEPKSDGFRPTISGLTIDESYTGCSFVARYQSDFTADALVKIKTGNLKPMLAEIRWAKKLSPKVIHVGIEYLE